MAAVVAKNAVGSSWRKTIGSREWSRVPGAAGRGWGGRGRRWRVQPGALHEATARACPWWRGRQHAAVPAAPQAAPQPCSLPPPLPPSCHAPRRREGIHPRHRHGGAARRPLGPRRAAGTGAFAAAAAAAALARATGRQCMAPRLPCTCPCHLRRCSAETLWHNKLQQCLLIAACLPAPPCRSRCLSPTSRASTCRWQAHALFCFSPVHASPHMLSRRLSTALWLAAARACTHHHPLPARTPPAPPAALAELAARPDGRGGGGVAGGAARQAARAAGAQARAAGAEE